MNDTTTRRTGQSRGRAFTTDAAAKPSHAAPAEETAVAKAQQTAVSTAVDYGDDAGAGMEGVSQSEMLMPFVRIVQPTAGVLKEGNPAYDETVRQGMMYNTASGEFYRRDVGFGFVPCFREASYSEWVPIAQGGGDGGGFRGVWSHGDPRIAALLKEQGAFKVLKTEAGTELVETFTVYGIVVPLEKEGDAIVWRYDLAAPGVIAFTSTQIKKYRTLVTRLNALVGQPNPRYPMWCWRWHVTTQPEKNKKGDYYGWSIRLAADTADEARLLPTDPLYLTAREVHHLIAAGGAKADFAQSGAAADEATASGRGPTLDATAQGGDAESEIPF